MQQYLSKEAFRAFTAAVDKGTLFDQNVADQIASGMQRWAKERGATHYTHWFQPLTDGTAEKHDGFIDFGDDNQLIEYGYAHRLPLTMQTTHGILCFSLSKCDSIVIEHHCCLP